MAWGAPYLFRLIKANQTSTPGAQPEIVTWSAAEYATYGGAGISAASGSYTIQRDGVYHVAFGVELQDVSGADNEVTFQIEINGTQDKARAIAMVEANQTVHVHLASDLKLSAGDVVRLVIEQSTGNIFIWAASAGGRILTWWSLHEIGGPMSTPDTP